MKILCATNLLPRSDAAVERSASLADESKANLSLLHVVPPISSESALMEELREAGLQLKGRSQPPRWAQAAPPSLIVRTGNPADIVLDSARELKADLVVVGPHRRRTIREAFRGSMAEKLVEARRFPILVVRAKPRGTYRNVVLALDLAEASARAVRYTESAGIVADSSRFTVLHAFEPPYQDTFHYLGGSRSSIDTHIAGWRREYRQSIADILLAQSERPWRYDVVLEEGRAPSVILNHLQRQAPDLLIMGTRGGGRMHRALLGSVAREVAHQARCDVLLVPQGAVSARGESEMSGSLRSPDVMKSPGVYSW
jgi:universal stress protein E